MLANCSSSRVAGAQVGSPSQSAACTVTDGVLLRPDEPIPLMPCRPAVRQCPVGQ